MISIHTSAREVTIALFLSMWYHRISIHTSAREVTESNPEGNSKSCDFNPHFRKGSDRDNSIVYDPFADFNPHFRKGSDSKVGESAVLQTQFQSTLPQGK